MPIFFESSSYLLIIRLDLRPHVMWAVSLVITYGRFIFVRGLYGNTVNQQILEAIKFGVSQNKVIYVNLAAIKFGVSPRPVCAVYDRRICWWRQILAKTRNSPNSPNIIARQNLLIYSILINILYHPCNQLLLQNLCISSCVVTNTVIVLK